MNQLDPNRLNYRLDVQGLRAVAVGLVVLYHAGVGVHGGFLGVDVFFVISGFVISDMIAREISRSGLFSAKDFLVRRLKRLFPALATMLGFAVLYSLLFESWVLEQRRTQMTALAAMFSISNWKFATDVKSYFDIDNGSNPLLHTWSLGVEEQFYIFVAIIVAIGVSLSRKNRIGKKTVVTLLTCGLVGSLILQVLFSIHLRFDLSQLSDFRRLIYRIGTPFYGTPSRAWEFLVGVLLWMFAMRKIQGHLKRQKTIQYLGIAGIIFTVFMTRNRIPPGSLPNIAVVISTALTLSASSIDGPSNSGKRILTNRYLVWIGDRSYGWYLWHWPFIVYSGRLFPHSQNAVIAAAILSLIPATISYRYIECPFRRWSPRSKSTIMRAVVIMGLSLGVLIGTCFYIVTPFQDRRSGGGYSDLVEGCDPTDSPCVFENGDSIKTMLLEGDSHAQTLRYPVLRLARQNGFNLVICGRQCILSQTVPILDEQYSFSVIISMRRYQDIPGVGFNDLIEYVSSRPRIRTVLVADNPEWGDHFVFPSLFGKQTPDLTLDYVMDQQRTAIELLSLTERKFSNISVLHSLDVLCDAETCPTRRSGQRLYSDGHHLSIAGSNLLYDSLVAAVTKSAQ